MSVPQGTVPAMTQAPPTDEQKLIRDFVHGLVTATITKKSARDHQRLPGPSDLANPCDLCVARKIAAVCGTPLHTQAEDRFSHKAWIGTAVHEKLERDLPDVYAHAEREITVNIANIEGLGLIKGHVDLYLPVQLTMTDYKTVDMKKLQVIRATGVPTSHVGQTMLYMYGLKQSDKPVNYATLVYIPRDSNKVSDIWVASCAYREDIALALLNRTRRLVQQIKSGNVTKLESASDCYVCHVQPLIRH